MSGVAQITISQSEKKRLSDLLRGFKKAKVLVIGDITR